MVTGFRQGLTATGFNEGQNVRIEYRYADDQPERLPGLVTELIRLPVAVIVLNGTAALAAKAATTTVPIVFVTGSDPVEIAAAKPLGAHAEDTRAALSGTGSTTQPIGAGLRFCPGSVRRMSALPLKADMCSATRYVR